MGGQGPQGAQGPGGLRSRRQARDSGLLSSLRTVSKDGHTWRYPLPFPEPCPKVQQPLMGTSPSPESDSMLPCPSLHPLPLISPEVPARLRVPTGPPGSGSRDPNAQAALSLLQTPPALVPNQLGDRPLPRCHPPRLPGPGEPQPPRSRTCSLVVRPLATSTTWNPVRPATGMKNNPATHITTILPAPAKDEPRPRGAHTAPKPPGLKPLPARRGYVTAMRTPESSSTWYST